MGEERRVSRTSLVRLADERVSILAVCREIGMSVPEDVPAGRSVKVYCPFGMFYHVDHGVEPAFRIYPDSNSAFCFAGCGFYSPVKLYAAARDLDSLAAAQVLLDSVGYKPLDLAHLWETVSAPPETVDTTSLAEALKVYCTRIDPMWEVRQFDVEVAASLSRCLELLPRVRTAQEARQWLDATKKVMARTLGAPDACSSP